ncbi:hypothetical protein KJ819_00050 [Patescibacteria group bacterium]|nr:hypothetical protein [Patescibacteria group bacterium]MBU1500593.1 hypothetical protein [Patescibacteria group bacterium]MBU2080366.1 hypothetical protein [Patescibacteria group bacterium]MBU2124222.1 hypothetical protein [Patescibacteria group bacterium]MBU2194327.1 hypothetical protein [Patescibacteria group bacterium]
MKHITFVHLSVALLLFIGLVSAYGFWYSLVGKASAQAAVLSEEIHQKSLESGRVAAARRALTVLAEDEAQVQKYLISENSVVPFLESLENTGKALGASVSVASVSAETSTTRPHLKLSLKITGSFDSVLRTLGAIEYGAYDSQLLTTTFDTPKVSDPAAPAEWTATSAFVIGMRAASSTTPTL